MKASFLKSIVASMRESGETIAYIDDGLPRPVTIELRPAPPQKRLGIPSAFQLSAFHLSAHVN
jgi:hypothetical protein